MITMQQFFELIEYKITEASTYGWQCYGPHAHSIDSWNGDQQGYTLSMVFDTRDQTVYEVTACDYDQNRAYRLIHPDYEKKHRKEAKRRDVNYQEAWDDVNFVDLELTEDFLEKAHAIRAGESYDDRVAVPVELPDAEMFKLMKLAHKADVTLNQYVANLLRDALDKNILAEVLTSPGGHISQAQILDSYDHYD